MRKIPKSRKRTRDLLPEYYFRNGVRAKYAGRYSRGTNVVVLAPDLVEYFPDSESTNQALRAWLDLAGSCES